MTRQKELQMLKAFIEKNGVTLLPPDERGPEMFKTVWTKSKKKAKNKKKAQVKVDKEQKE